MSAAFDGSGYRQRVLAVLRTRSPLRLDDPFFVADLDPDSGYTDGEVQTRLARVLAFLQRERSSAKYATLAAELVRRRAEWEAPLRAAETRERIRQRVIEARRDGDAERLAKVDGYLATVRERFGGIPLSRVDGLRRLAVQAGVSGERFDARLARERLIDDAVGVGATPLPADVRGQIRERLEELRALRHGDHVSTASLWAFLGVAPDASPDRLAGAYEAVAAVNARRPHDREKTVTADLLALVRARLLEGDPAAYTAGLLADAAGELRGAVEEHVLLDGEITAVAFEGLIRRALGAGRGLSVAQVRSVVLGLARDLGVPVSTGATIDFVVCPGCGRPEPVGEVRVCRYCDTDLYIVCPTCGRFTEAAAVVCRQCGQSVRQSRDATEALAAIRRALDDGRPAAAAELVGRARPVLAAVGAAAVVAGDELAARVSAALAAADAGWRALADDRGAGRAEAALERARWLVGQAADVPGQDGRLAAEVLEELTMAQAMIRRRVDAALALPPAAREAALVAVLASASDSPEALAALAALPLAPAVDLVAMPAGGVSGGSAAAVLLRWRAGDAATAVSFRVERVVAGAIGAPPVRLSLGTTAATELTDAGAPAWTPVYYEVTAISGSRWSTVARTAPLVLSRDVDEVRAQQTSDGVRLTWRLEGPVQLVTVERAVEAVEPVEPADALDTPADGSAGAGPPTAGLRISAPARPGPAGPADVDRSVRHTRVSGGVLTDPDVQPGVTYRYRLSVEYVEVDGSPTRTPGVEVTVTVGARPRPVVDLSVAFAAGETMLRWTTLPGVDVRIYATPGVLPDAGAAAAGRYPTTPPVQPGPFGHENSELPLGAVTGSARLVGTSRRGRLLDAAAVGPVIYTPVSVLGGHGVVGRPVQHVAPGGVLELRAEDRGDELVLFFRLAPGLTEARVLWRRDRMPTGPDDPAASAATVTIAGLALRGGGWRLAAPRDGWPYYVACFPVFRVNGQPRAGSAGAELLARSPAVPASTGPIAMPDAHTGPSYLAPLPPGPATGALPAPTGALPLPSPVGVGPGTSALPLPLPPAPGQAGPQAAGFAPPPSGPHPAAAPPRPVPLPPAGLPPSAQALPPSSRTVPAAMSAAPSAGPSMAVSPLSPAGTPLGMGPPPSPVAPPPAAAVPSSPSSPSSSPLPPLLPPMAPAPASARPQPGQPGVPGHAGAPGQATQARPLPPMVNPPTGAGGLPIASRPVGRPQPSQEPPAPPRPAYPQPHAQPSPGSPAGADAWAGPAGRPAPPAGPAAPPTAQPWAPTATGGPAAPGWHFPALDVPGWPVPVGSPTPGPQPGWTLPAVQGGLYAPGGQRGYDAGPGAGPGGHTDQLAVAPPGEPADVATMPPAAPGRFGTEHADGDAAAVAGDVADGEVDGEVDDRPPDDDADDDLGYDPDDDLDGDAAGEPWVTYSVSRAGWRRRVLRVRVRSGGAVPELVLVARPGTVPPAELAEGQALARLTPTAARANRTMEVRLEGALLPWGIRVLAVADGADVPVVVDHPSDDALVVR